MITLINDIKLTAAANMAKDQALLAALTPSDPAILRFYDWEKPSATFGHFIDPWKFLHPSSLDLAKRPTGGGVTFHLSDLTYSFFLPSNSPHFSKNTRKNLSFVHRTVASAINCFFGKKCCEIVSIQKECSSLPTFCMAEPVCFDLLWEGKKIAGGAQRRTKSGFLHQGSISLYSPDNDLLRKALKEPLMMQQMQENGGALFEELSFAPSIPSFKEALLDAFNEALQGPFGEHLDLPSSV